MLNLPQYRVPKVAGTEHDYRIYTEIEAETHGVSTLSFCEGSA